MTETILWEANRKSVPLPESDLEFMSLMGALQTKCMAVKLLLKLASPAERGGPAPCHQETLLHGLQRLVQGGCCWVCHSFTHVPGINPHVELV